MSSIDFVTDTATLCIFDLASLKHRLHDDADWWTDPDIELQEVNLGNVAFFGLGTDGVYEVEIVDQHLPDTPHVNIRAPSGRLFVGAGEEVTSDGLEPEGLRGALFEVAPGNYSVAAKLEESRVLLCLAPSESGENCLAKRIRL